MTCQRSNRGSEAEDKDWKALRFAGDQAMMPMSQECLQAMMNLDRCRIKPNTRFKDIKD